MKMHSHNKINKITTFSLLKVIAQNIETIKDEFILNEVERIKHMSEAVFSYLHV